MPTWVRDTTIALTGPRPDRKVPAFGPFSPEAPVAKVPLIVIGRHELPGHVLAGGVAEIRSGKHAGCFIALACALYEGRTPIRDDCWLTSKPFASRERAYAFLFAFLEECTYHRWCVDWMLDEEEVAA